MPAADQSSQHQQEQATGQKTELRVRLLGQLNDILSARDTPRGVLATVRDADFNGPVLRPIGVDQVARIAAIVAAYPELRVDVDGHTDSAGTEALSGKRAEAAREVLVGNGLPANAVVARGFDHTRLLVSNANTTGRLENRRVEIVISGDPIGNLAFWDRSYSSLLPQRQQQEDPAAGKHSPVGQSWSSSSGSDSSSLSSAGRVDPDGRGRLMLYRLKPFRVPKINVHR